MNRNPLIPFFLIMVLGIGLMFAFSFIGLNNAEELAKGEEGGADAQQDVASATPEEIYQKSCVSCHGQNYEGGVGPALTGIGDRLSQDDIKSVLQNGQGAMPGGLVPDEKLDEMTQWLSELK